MELDNVQQTSDKKKVIIVGACDDNIKAAMEIAKHRNDKVEIVTTELTMEELGRLPLSSLIRKCDNPPVRDLPRSFDPYIGLVDTNKEAFEIVQMCEEYKYLHTPIIDRHIELSPVRDSKVNPKIGRNEPCPCGSGKKYKKCCLK